MAYQAGLHPYESVDWARVRDLYVGDVQSADLLLAGLVAVLEEAGLYEQTVLIVTSDHGENLGDHGLVDHQFSVHETLLAVPLVVRAPGRLPAGRREDPVMLTDLFATIVELAGIRGVRSPRHSNSLLAEPLAASRPLVAEYFTPQAHLTDSLLGLNPQLDVTPLLRSYQTVRVGGWRLNRASDGTVTLHEVGRDPAQAHDLAVQRSQDVVALTALLDKLLPQAGPAKQREVELDARTLEQLRALGYVR